MNLFNVTPLRNLISLTKEERSFAAKLIWKQKKEMSLGEARKKIYFRYVRQIEND